MTQAHAAVPYEGDAWLQQARPVRGGDAWQAAPASAARPAPIPRVPSGWYPEPARLRFWDGEHWTEQTCVAAPPDPRARVVAPAPWPEAPAAVLALHRPEREGAVAAETPRAGGLRELRRFLTVALLAIVSGAAVAALGIALTV